MKILLNEKYKSLNEIFEIELPDFTIISGVNGAGKSHLLKALDEKKAYAIDSVTGHLLQPIKYINSNSLNPNDSYQVNREAFINEINGIYFGLENFYVQKRANPNIDIHQHFQYNLPHLNAIHITSRNTGKALEEITREDLLESMPLYYNLVQDIFHQNFSAIFKRYSDKYDDNAYNQFLNQQKGKDKKFLTDEDFFRKYGPPPWELVNKIFHEANIGYTINDPIEEERDFPYTFKLINKTNGATVNFSDLSSGEKVLMSLILAIYNSHLDTVFPGLLLLDEPDAPLHPSMAKQLLNVISEVFVKEKGVKVILTTHSPSTIAMAPEDSLYIMQKHSPRIIKESKEYIMKILTDGIPSFSVYTDNRRQVFVESKVDEDFYTKIYNKIKKYIKSEKSLNFIHSGLTNNNSGNCEQVKKIVSILANNGNKTIYGIIDWDNKNKKADKVFVLGEQKRYSIENYVFDPILLANFLLREKIINNAYFGLDEDDAHFLFPKFPISKLQSIVDKITSDISNNIIFSEKTLIDTYYIGGISLKIPIWYLHSNGHDLENAITATYQQLKKFKNELKEEIVKKVIDDLPDFIATDLLELMQDLHN